MRNLVIGAVVVVILIGAFFVFSKGEAEKTFEEFGKAWAKVRFKDADPMMEGDAVKETFKKVSVMTVARCPIGVVGSVEFKDTSKTKNSEGGLDYSSHMTVFFNPPGVESALTATMWAKINFRATLKETGGVWKVCAMDPELIEVAGMNN